MANRFARDQVSRRRCQSRGPASRKMGRLWLSSRFKTEEIDICARHLSVADAFERYTSDRCNQAGSTLRSWAQELEEWSNRSNLDPKVVEAFHRCERRLDEHATSIAKRKPASPNAAPRFRDESQLNAPIS